MPAMDDLMLDLHPVGAANGALRIAIDVRDPQTDKCVVSDTVNLRSSKSRLRLAQAIDDYCGGGNLHIIDLRLVSLVDQAKAAALTAGEETQRMPFGIVEPWHEPVAGAELLEAVQAALLRYLVLPDDTTLPMALWVMAAWHVDTWDLFPHLVFSSATKRCGKSRALAVLRHLCPRAISSSNMSPAALYRTVSAYRPTMLVDEGQWLNRGTRNEGHEAIREILCAAVERDASKVIRMGGERGDELQIFDVYGAKVVALIGKLDDVLADRSIVIPMRRKRRGESRRRWNTRQAGDYLGRIASKLARWAEDAADQVQAAYDAAEPLDFGDNDRAAEMWGPLFTLVEILEPSRRAELHASAKTLVGDDLDDDTVGVRLLAAIRDIFDDRGVSFVSTESLLNSLHERAGEPWGDWRAGKPMSARALSDQLGKFAVKSDRTKEDRNTRGYWRKALEGVWADYSLYPQDTAHEAPEAPEAPPIEPIQGASGASGA